MWFVWLISMEQKDTIQEELACEGSSYLACHFLIRMVSNIVGKAQVNLRLESFPVLEVGRRILCEERLLVFRICKSSNAG